MYFDDSPYAGQLLFDPQEDKIMPETKAISSAMASFLFMELKFDLQSNAFFRELLPSLQNNFENMEVKKPNIDESWYQVLRPQFEAPYFADLKSFLVSEKRQYAVYPPGPLIFNAFNLTPFDKVKVVILGQDPYHGPGQAHGLSFSVPDGVPFPPSLQNIFKELHDDLGVPMARSGNLEKWAREGVLLLNASLTVRAGQAASHSRHGWEQFTDAAIRALSEYREHLVFILWGNYAIAKQALIDPFKHLILKSVHPSPLSASRGFFGCHHFSQTNNYLIQNGIEPIDWSLP